MADIAKFDGLRRKNEEESEGIDVSQELIDRVIMDIDSAIQVYWDFIFHSGLEVDVDGKTEQQHRLHVYHGMIVDYLYAAKKRLTKGGRYGENSL